MNKRHANLGDLWSPHRRRARRVALLVCSVATLFGAASLTFVGSGGIASAASAWDEPANFEAEEVTAVHGQWSIRVSDPDGGPVRSIEFSNDLTEGGAKSLSALLAGDAVSGVWSVQLFSSDSGSLCEDGQCNMHTPDNSTSSGSSSLSVLVPDSGEMQGALVLDGSIAVGAAGIIDAVRAQRFICGSSVTVSACETDSSPTSATTVSEADFSKTGTSPIVVEAGQIIDVTVIISFS